MRVAVLGTGRLGSFRARVLGELSGVEEVIVGNRTAGRAEELARELGGTACSIDEALESGPDAVFVSVATELHADLLHRCVDERLDEGLKIFCEKPLAPTLAETEAVIRHAEEAGVGIQVAFQRRQDPDYRRAYEEISSGEVGTLYNLRITAHDAEPAPEEFISLSGGTYRDLHIHDFDLARWLTGLEVQTVYAVGGVRGFGRYARHGDIDNAAVLITMSDGLPVLLTGTRHSPRGHDFHLEVFGSRDSVSVGDHSKSQPRPVEPDAPVPERGPYRDFIERFGTCLRQETVAFTEFVAGGRENPCPPEASLAALRAAIACEVSDREGRPVRVSEITEDPPPLPLGGAVARSGGFRPPHE